MAIISTIRNNSWILIVLIGLGLGGFLMMDMFSGNTSVMGSPPTEVGSINGEQLEINDLNRREGIYNFIYGGNTQGTYNTKDFLWNHMLEEKIIENKATNLGLGVSKDELIELQFGQNLSPVIQARFSDPNTRQINRENLNQIKQAIETDQLRPDYRQYWAYQETEVVKERLQSKYTNLISKSILYPDWMVEVNKEIGNKSKKVALVQIPFDRSDINPEITKEQIEAYISNHKKDYTFEEEKRKLVVVNIKVTPTSQDSTQLLQEITELKAQMETTDQLNLLVEQNEGINDTAYVLKEEVSPAVSDTLEDLPVGGVYGPYTDAGEYRVMKLVDKKIIADSVKSRHILIQPNATGFAQAQKTVDSLKNLIETGQNNFDSLALNFGTDATATRGGDLGFTARGQMVKPFNDLIFYYAEPGELYTVTTQFGVHLVEVTDRKYEENTMGYRLAYLRQPIVPSEATQDKKYEEAQEIVRENRTLEALRAYVNNDPSLILTETELLGPNDFRIQIMGDEQLAREAIRWAFNNADEGQVSEDVYTKQNTVNYFNSNYFLVALDQVIEEGLAKAEDVRPQVEPLVRNELRGEDLMKSLEGMQLGAIASRFNADVDTINNVVVSNSFVPKIGNEPELVGKIVQTEPSSETKIVKGNNGVYAFSVVSESQNTIVESSFEQRMRSMYSADIKNVLMENLKEKAETEDLRSEFY